MSTNRIVRIVVGLALIGYGIYSGNAWFYLGVVPLITGIINWCPLEMKMGTCDPASGCCASPASAENTSACCTPAVPKESGSTCCSTPASAQSTVAKDASNFSFSASKKGTIEILGTGCKKCKELEMAAREAVTALDADYEVIKVEDIQEIANYGVTSTPALVVDGVVKSKGRLLSVDEIKEILS